jgi:hypothetical protein
MPETPAGRRVSDLFEDPAPASLLPFSDPGFVAPTHADVRALTQRYKLTGAAVAQLTGVLPRTVRKWLAPPNVANHSPIPYAAWRLLLIEVGLAGRSSMIELEE